MITNSQEYLQIWEKQNNPSYPDEMKWDRVVVNKFLAEYEKQKGNRFIKPTGQEMVDFAILFNNGRIDKNKMVDMIAMCNLIIDRLYEHGDIKTKSSQEITE